MWLLMTIQRMDRDEEVEADSVHSQVSLEATMTLNGTPTLSSLTKLDMQRLPSPSHVYLLVQPIGVTTLAELDVKVPDHPCHHQAWLKSTEASSLSVIASWGTEALGTSLLADTATVAVRERLEDLSCIVLESRIAQPSFRHVSVGISEISRRAIGSVHVDG